MDDREKDIARENQESKESAQKQYEFITETIKKRPVNKKRILSKIFFTLFLAVLFAVTACVTAAFLFPHIYNRVNPEEPKPVTLPVAEEAIEEPVEEFVPSEEDEDFPDAPETNENDETTDISDENKETDSEANTGETEADNKEVVINQVVETVEKELELEDYRTLYRKIASVGNSVQKCMVKVSGISSNTDWFNNTYDDNDSASGVIVADNGKELLIVSLNAIVDDAEEVEVTFCDGSVYKSTVKKADPGTGLTVVAVNLSDISEMTRGKIEMATFGSVSSMVIGTPVLAVGSPLGVADSMALGQITSTSTTEITDGSVKILSTDIYGSTSASGVIVNLNGRILGIICPNNNSDMANLITAYSITDVKDKIEKISNGQDIATLGIIGTDVTEAAFNELGVPFGTYVKKVDIDSPAMTAGIRSGDVIVKMGTTEIKSFNDYKDVLLKSQPGDNMIVTIMRPGREKYFEVVYEVTLKSL